MKRYLPLAALLLALPAWATTHYVDNCVVTSSDSNNSTSTRTPWFTINKVNTSTFQPGDSVLFHRTCTWREQLTLLSSRSTGNPITIGDYGNGALPKIRGTDNHTSADANGNYSFTGLATGTYTVANPAIVVGGNSSTGTVTLRAPPAPAGGTVVSLSSGNTAVATVPATVTVPANSLTPTFTITTTAVGAATQLNISGSYNGNAQASFTVNPGSLIPQSGWSLVSVDSQETICGNGVGANAFDGNPSTMWHTQFCPSSAPMPHQISINLGASYTLTAFQYLPRQDGSACGWIKDYAFYVSSDGVNWGTAVATGTFNYGNLSTNCPGPGASVPSALQIAFPPTTGQYIRLVALDELHGNPWTSMAELNVLGPVISQAVWSLVSVDSQETICGNGVGTNAFDGNPSTMWHTQFCPSSAPMPHQISINLGASYNLTAFQYLPRQDGSACGWIKDYAFYVSSDGVNWGTAAATGTFNYGNLSTNCPGPGASVPSALQIAFPQTTGQYIRLVALDELHGNPWTSAAELNVLGTVSANNPPPTLAQVTVNPAIVVGGTSAQGTVSLSGPAPAAGAVVSLASSDPSTTVPLTVTVPANAVSANFTITTTAVGTVTQLNISGSYSGNAAQASFTVNPGSLISQSGWSLVSVDSQETICGNGVGTNAFDGNPSTMWHTQFCPSSAPMPHQISINLGASYNLTAFQYLPRQDGSACGWIKDYAFYVSSDGVNWGTAAATGTFNYGNLSTNCPGPGASVPSALQIAFPQTTGQYIRLVALDELHGNPWTSMAELNVLDSTNATYSISGTLSPAALGSGVTVALSGAAGATTTTDSSGNYVFSGLVNGSYTLTPTMSGTIVTPPSQTVTVNGASITGVNFAVLVPTWIISGTITPAANGVGATVTLSGAAFATTTADASGNYSFSGLANGTYSVTPSESGYLFSPAAQSAIISSANVANVNFTVSVAPVAVSISPTSVSLVTGGIQQFTPTVTGTTNTAVTWTATGGTVSTNGLYTAPGTAGAYTVTATSAADTAKSASATVTVTTAGSVLLGDPNVETQVGSIPVAQAEAFQATANASGTMQSLVVYLDSTSTVSQLVVGLYADASGHPGALLSQGSSTMPVAGAWNPILVPAASLAAGTPYWIAILGTTSGTLAFREAAPGSCASEINAQSSLTSLPASWTTGTVGSNCPASVFGDSTKVVFFDNFPGTTLSSYWTIISRHGEYTQDETECNVPSMVAVSNGLTITTQAQSASCGDYFTAASSWPYITGDIQWANLNFTYGSIEIEAKFPSVNTSLWPATWLLGTNCQYTNPLTGSTGVTINGYSCPNLGQSGYQEIDMTECYGGPGGWCGFTVFNPNVSEACNRISYSVDANWHLFTTVWNASSVSQYMDGNLVTTCNQAMSGPMFLIIQTQTGGVGGTPNNAYLPATLGAEYVKVTQP